MINPDVNPMEQIWLQLEKKEGRSTVQSKESLWLERRKRWTFSGNILARHQRDVLLLAIAANFGQAKCLRRTKKTKKENSRAPLQGVFCGAQIHPLHVSGRLWNEFISLEVKKGQYFLICQVLWSFRPAQSMHINPPCTAEGDIILQLGFVAHWVPFKVNATWLLLDLCCCFLSLIFWS